jgi:hypothetical protein
MCTPQALQNHYLLSSLLLPFNMLPIMSFDVAECISLRNLIVERACAQLPANLQPTITRNWFTVHWLDASAPGLGFDLTDSLDAHAVTLSDTAREDPYEAEYVEFEGTLRRYLSYIDARKFVVDTSYEHSGYGDELAYQGWRYEGWLEEEMEFTLHVWNTLIDKIAERTPGAPTAETHEVLVPLSILDFYPSSQRSLELFCPVQRNLLSQRSPLSCGFRISILCTALASN